jgi:hypothetical protein
MTSKLNAEAREDADREALDSTVTDEASRPADVDAEGQKPKKKRKKKSKKKAEEPSAFRAFESTYMTADPRSLGLFRIALGILLFIDVARRFPDIEAHYSNTGWLTNHFALFRPMSNYLFSVYLAFSTPLEVKVLMTLHLVVLFLFIIGYRTRLMHVFAAVLLVSINSRNILLENGGWVVLTLLTVWSMFLPLGRRFSVDAVLASLRERREKSADALNQANDPVRISAPVVSVAVLALILQWTLIYYFNAVHKNGELWRNGSAVYYFFHQDRMVTAFGGWVRHYIPLGMYKWMTWSTLVIEYAIAFLLVVPIKTQRARMLAWLLVCMLHLSIDAVVQLGPFSWAMVIMFFILIPTEAWEKLGPKLAARRPTREFTFDPKSEFQLMLCRVVKRLDVFGKVRFVEVPALESAEQSAAANTVTAAKSDSVSDADEEDDEDEDDDEELARPEAQADDDARPIATRPLTVRDPQANKAYTGAAAIVRLADAFPLGSLPFLWAKLPIIKNQLDRRLEKASRNGEQVDAYFELEKNRTLPEYPAPTAPAKLFLQRSSWYAGEALCVIIMIACGSQVLMENRAIPQWAKPQSRPEWMTAVVVYPRLFQGWSMFAPSPPSDDGRVIVDGRTKGGRKLDPLTGKEPDFDIGPWGGFRMNQIWGDFHRRIPEDRFSTYWGGVKDYLLNHHQITGRPDDELVAFDVWYVTENIPPPGMKAEPPHRRKLFSHGTMR